MSGLEGNRLNDGQSGWVLDLLRLANDNDIRSLAMPAIGTGMFKFPPIKPDDTKRLVARCQRAKWIEIQQYKVDYKDRACWVLTEDGRLFAGLVASQALKVAESPPSAN